MRRPVERIAAFNWMGSCSARVAKVLPHSSETRDAMRIARASSSSVNSRRARSLRNSSATRPSRNGRSRPPNPPARGQSGGSAPPDLPPRDARSRRGASGGSPSRPSLSRSSRVVSCSRDVDALCSAVCALCCPATLAGDAAFCADETAAAALVPNNTAAKPNAKADDATSFKPIERFSGRSAICGASGSRALFSTVLHSRMTDLHQSSEQRTRTRGPVRSSSETITRSSC